MHPDAVLVGLNPHIPDVFRTQKPGAILCNRLHAGRRRVPICIVRPRARDGELRVKHAEHLSIERFARTVMPYLQHVDIAHDRSVRNRLIRLRVAGEHHGKLALGLLVPGNKHQRFLVF